MIEPNEQYDLRRCRTCGISWLSYIDETTGDLIPGHPTDIPCSRTRPSEPMEPVDPPRMPLRNGTMSKLQPIISDGVKARREVVGGVPTGEWPEDTDCFTVREWAERVPTPEPPTGTAEADTKASNGRHKVVTLTEWRYP